MKKIIWGVVLLIPLLPLFITDGATFALVKSIRQPSLVPYVKVFNWLGDGGLLLLFCLVLYAWGHARQWDLQGRGEALKDVVRAPLNKKGKSWKEMKEEIFSKLYRFFQSPAERAAFQGALALVLAGLGTRILKVLVGRPRPSAAARGIENWGPSLFQHHDSFPSGHSTSAFAVATALALYYPRWTPFLFIMAVLVALARVYLGHHYFADVYGGALIGIMAGFLARKFLKAMEKSSGVESDSSTATAPEP